MHYMLEIKFRMELFGLKSVLDSRDDAIFKAVIKGREFEELIRTFEKTCEEVCRDKQLKNEFLLTIKDIRESPGAEKVEDLFKDHKFEQAVVTLEKIYITIYGKTGEYDAEYQHFLQEIKRIANSPSSIRMWLKIVFAAAVTATATAVYKKVRKKENSGIS